VRGFEKTHQPNLTGTDGAYRPSGCLAKGGARPPATGDYQAWKPD
jgi:NADH:ubiquinone oxidoreductase subunit